LSSETVIKFIVIQHVALSRLLYRHHHFGRYYCLHF